MEQRTKLDRIKMLESMHYLISSLNDENAYYNAWIYVMPDGATDDDFADIAEDNKLYDEVCALFTRLIKRYGDSGYYAIDDTNSFGQRITVEINGEKKNFRLIPEECTRYSREHWELLQDIDEDYALYHNAMDGLFVSRKDSENHENNN